MGASMRPAGGPAGSHAFHGIEGAERQLASMRPAGGPAGSPSTVSPTSCWTPCFNEAGGRSRRIDLRGANLAGAYLGFNEAGGRSRRIGPV